MLIAVVTTEMVILDGTGSFIIIIIIIITIIIIIIIISIIISIIIIIIPSLAPRGRKKGLAGTLCGLQYSCWR